MTTYMRKFRSKLGSGVAALVCAMLLSAVAYAGPRGGGGHGGGGGGFYGGGRGFYGGGGGFHGGGGGLRGGGGVYWGGGSPLGVPVGWGGFSARRRAFRREPV